jgi:ribosomal protein L7/L12
MVEVHLKGYRPGVNIVEYVKVVRRFTGLGLARAKDAVDRSILGEQVGLELPDLATAEQFASDAAAVGGVVEVELVPPTHLTQ